MSAKEQVGIRNSQSVIIIGGGVSGLSAAHHLCELQTAGKFKGDFLLLEAGDRLGGVIETVSSNGFLLESGADSFLPKKPAALELIRRLNLEDKLIQTNEENRRSFLIRENRLRAVPPGFQLIAPSNVPAFFASEILSSSGKLRLANERFLPPKLESEDESLADFVRRRFGQEALERIAQPMFAGIYTANPEKLSISATQPRFLELERKYGSVINGLEQEAKHKTEQLNNASGARYNLFLSFQGGMQTLINAFASKLTADSIRLQTKAKKLFFDSTKRLWQVETQTGETLLTDAICLALPAFAAAKLLENQFPALANELYSIEYASTATINFGFRREQVFHPLDGFGFVVPYVERRTLIAATFSSVKLQRRAPEDHVLIRAFVGGALQPEMFELKDDKMIEGALHDLRGLLGITGKPLFARVGRWTRSMPQYHVGHIAKVDRIKKLLALTPTLQFATNAFYGVGVFDCIGQGQLAANSLLTHLS